MNVNRLKTLSPAFFLISDIIALNIAFFSAVLLRFDTSTPLHSVYYDYYVQLYVLLHAIWMALYFQNISNRSYTNFTEISNSFNRRWVVLLIVYSIVLVSLKGYYYSRLFAFIFFILLLIVGNIFIFITSKLIRYYYSTLGLEKIILIGNNEFIEKGGISFTENIKNGYSITALMTDHPDEELTRVTSMNITAVISTYRETDRLNYVQTWCDKHYIPHYILLYELPNLPISANIFKFNGLTVVKLRNEPLSSPLNALLKRAADLILSIILSALLIVPFFIVMIVLWIYWKELPIFSQRRYGQTGKIFTLYKFKTMKENEVPGICFFLRKFSIDEWPQIYNVFKGEMSIIGPRPYHLEDIEKFKQKSTSFLVRHWVKPGITGLAQIRGYRGKIQDELHFKKRLENDVWYIENWSFTLDIKIFFLTIFHVLKGDGK